jgi:NCS1 nucleoside transporter family
MVISSFALGVLGKSIFYLGSADAFLVVLFANMVGILPVCFFSCFGAHFGLRQMIMSRYWFGYHGVKLIAVFNVIACIGWSTINTIVGAELIHAVNSNVPGWVGIIIITVCTFIVTLFGYKIVHIYEFWSWIPAFIVFVIIIIEFARSGAYIDIPMGVGTSEMGSVFSFFATVFGFAIGWASYASDYTVYQPPTQSKVKIFFATYIGLIIPLCFTQFIGVAVMTATDATATDPSYAEGYAESGSGGLLAAVLVPPLGGFGQFCLILMALSIIANNCPNIYSVSITMQVFGSWTRKVPRPMWTLIGSVIYAAIAIPGYSHFETILENFMNLIGYWLSSYSAVAIVEHFVFRKGFGGYDVDDHDKPNKLPHGFAAVFSFLCGLVGAILGMSQTWYVGKIALHAGEAPYGGDVGVELAWAFATVAYLVTRPIELKYFKR